jgi:hypothetical protein
MDYNINHVELFDGDETMIIFMFIEDKNESDEIIDELNDLYKDDDLVVEKTEVDDVSGALLEFKINGDINKNSEFWKKIVEFDEQV